MSYRWKSAHDWLIYHLERLAEDEDVRYLQVAAQLMGGMLDGDQIQRLFESSMDKDGYFKEIE